MSIERPKFSARLPLLFGFTSVALLLGGFGAWSVGTEIAGAVVASGQIEVESKRQIVQHPDGGVVGDILVRDGDGVDKGDLLIQFDDTFLMSELAIVEGQLSELFARRMRLEAERDGETISKPTTLPDFRAVPTDQVNELLQGQIRLQKARTSSLSRQTEQLAEQQAQVRSQIVGTEAQLAAFNDQITLIQPELDNAESLLERGLIQSARVLELKREKSRLDGEIGRLTSQISEARARIAAIEIEILRLEDGRREEAITSLRDLGVNEQELKERRLSLLELLSRLNVRAPASGTVFDMRVTTLGAVISPAEPILSLVPQDQPLRVIARVDPLDVEQIYPSQQVSVVFSAFNLRTLPDIPGRVVTVGADVSVDEVTGLGYYEAIVAPDTERLASLTDLTPVPGMPVEVFLKTDERTPLNYLTQPLTSYFKRAFREE